MLAKRKTLWLLVIRNRNKMSEFPSQKMKNHNWEKSFILVIYFNNFLIIQPVFTSFSWHLCRKLFCVFLLCLFLKQTSVCHCQQLSDINCIFYHFHYTIFFTFMKSLIFASFLNDSISKRKKIHSVLEVIHEWSLF